MAVDCLLCLLPPPRFCLDPCRLGSNGYSERKFHPPQCAINVVVLRQWSVVGYGVDESFPRDCWE